MKYAYVVTWQIDVEADTPEEAAHAALRIQKRNQWATVFNVAPYGKPHEEVTIDLGEVA